jgi:hypothetical protein
MRANARLKLSIILLAIILGLIACKKDYNSNSRQRIYFEHYVSNFAWAPIYVHWIVDDRGNVRINRKNSRIWINTHELTSYINFFDTIIYKLNMPEFNQYVNMIENASGGKIDSTVLNMADFGGIGYSCFWFDKIKNRYNSIVLSEVTDFFSKENTDSSARRISKWLKSIDSAIYIKQ